MLYTISEVLGNKFDNDSGCLYFCPSILNVKISEPNGSPVILTASYHCEKLILRISSTRVSYILSCSFSSSAFIPATLNVTFLKSGRLIYACLYSSTFCRPSVISPSFFLSRYTYLCFPDLPSAKYTSYFT